MSLRRGFTLAPGARAIVVEDVITTGGSTREVIEIVRAAGAIRGRRGLDHRSQRRRGRSRHSARGVCETLTVPVCRNLPMPMCLNGEPVMKPGSRPGLGWRYAPHPHHPRLRRHRFPRLAGAARAAHSPGRARRNHLRNGRRSVHVAGSGRTDAGVHALAQVAAFTIANPIPVDNLQRAVNRLLPPAIRVLEAAETHADFHPRFDAIAKTYQYTICSARRFVRRSIGAMCTIILIPLNEAAMTQAARVFEGEHDFTVFAASDNRESGRNPTCGGFSAPTWCVREIPDLHGPRQRISQAHGPKHGGYIIESGRGNISAPEIARLLSGDVSGKSGPTAPAKGLTLISVEYPPLT